jgi:hypothetical protein
MKLWIVLSFTGQVEGDPKNWLYGAPGRLKVLSGAVAYARKQLAGVYYPRFMVWQSLST